MMGFFSKLFGKKQPTGATVEVTQSWHYAGDGDCPPTRLLSVVQIPGPAPQDAAGFFNLGVYRVTGHIMNTQTGRQNKKVVKVNALSKNDAESAALELGVLPPLSIEVVDTLNQAPNEYQTSNAKEYGMQSRPAQLTRMCAPWWTVVVIVLRLLVWRYFAHVSAYSFPGILAKLIWSIWRVSHCQTVIRLPSLLMLCIVAFPVARLVTRQMILCAIPLPIVLDLAPYPTC